MKGKYFSFSALTLLFIVFLIVAAPQKIQAATGTYYELAPGASAVITTPSSTSISIKGNKFDYVKYDSNGNPLGCGEIDSSISYWISSSERIIVSNTSSSTIVLENSRDFLNVRSTSTPALKKKWLNPGQSVEISNKGSASTNIRIGGRYDAAAYKSGIVYSYGTDYTHAPTIPAGESLAITNQDTAGYNIYGPYETFSFTDRTSPAVFRTTLQKGKTLEIFNKTNNSFNVYHNNARHEYVRYDKQGNLHSYGVSTSTYTLSASERLIVTNLNENSMEIKLPYDAFTFSFRTLPALFTKTLQNGESLRIVNKGNKSHSLSFEGTYDFASYDPSGKLEEYAKDTVSSSKGISAGSSIVVTGTGSGVAKVMGPHDVFTVTDRDAPALFAYTLAPGAGMEATYKGSSRSGDVRITGKYDFAYYDSSGQLQKHEYNRSSGSQQVGTGERIAVQNSDKSNIVVYGAYDVFQVQGRTHPVTFKKTLAPGESMEATISDKRGSTLYMLGFHDHVKYDKEGRISIGRNRNTTQQSHYVDLGERFLLTNMDSSAITVEGAYDAFTIKNRENPALFTYTLAPGASMEATYKGTSGSAVVYMTGTYDAARYDSSGQFQNHKYHNSFFAYGEGVGTGERIAVQNSDKSNIVVYGAYDVFQVQGRTHPVTFKKTLAPGESMEATISDKRGSTLYMLGFHDHVKYDKEGEISIGRNRNTTQQSHYVDLGERFLLTNMDSSAITVEGAYDAFTIKNRENPALFTYTLAPGASMEATNIGSIRSVVYMTGMYDATQYDSSGRLQNYKYHNSFLAYGEGVGIGERIAVQNSDKSNIVVYGAYDVFQVQGRIHPVTFVHTLTADQTIEINQTSPKEPGLFLNGFYDYAQYDDQGKVGDFNFNRNNSVLTFRQGETMVISPTQGKTVTVSGAYDGGFEITNRSQRAVTIRTLQPAESYSFQNISPGGFEARISGVYDYQIFDSSGNLVESRSGMSWAFLGVGATRKLVITNADKTPITVAVPTDAVQEANNPDLFTKWLSSGQSMEAKNTSNTPSTLTVNGKYDFVLYNAAGEPVSYERETSTAALSVPSGYRVILTSRRTAGITVSGSVSAFTRTDQSNPALVQAKVDKKAVLKAINLKDSAQTVKIEGSFTYRLDREKEQVGQSPLTVPAGKTAWIRNTSENEFWVYSPYDYFQLEVGEAESEVISGVRAAEQIRKLNLGDYDSQSFHADPVDTSTGAQIMHLTPLTAHGAMPVPFQAQYHSLLTGKGALGTGWSHNYEVRLEPDSSGNKVTVFWNAFRANTFKRGRDGLFSSDEQATKRDRLTKRSDGTFELKRNDGTVYHFTASGRLTQLQEKTGLKLVFGYSSEGKLTSVTEPLTHAALTLSYNAGRIAKVEDQAHRATSFAYDAAGRMIKMIDPAGQVTEYTYDGEDRIVTVVIEGVQLFKNEYDNEGRIVEQQDANHAPTKFAYAEADGQLVTTITDRNGHTQKRTHDAKYKLLRVEDELGRKTTYTYDDEGNRTSETNTLNQTVTYNYDAQGNVTDVTYPTGQYLTMNYDANNNLVKLTRADGSTILSTYDSQNRLLTVTDPEGSTTSYRYDGNGLLVSMLDPLGGETLYGYTGNRLTSMKNAAGETITFGYDSAGRMVSEKDENGNGTVQTYNADDQLASETDALGHTITYTYDTQGFLRRETDARGNALAYTYDGNGNVTQITNALNETTTLAYDREGRLTSITNPLGNRTTYTYDAAGNLLAETNANGETVRYAYDELNRFIEAYGATGEKVYAVTYDAAGNPVTQTDALNHTQTNVFDQLNRLKQTTDPLQRTTNLQYDRLNRLTAVTDPLQGQASSSFDLLSRMTSVTDPNANTTAYTYDRVGRLTGETNATGSGRTYQYNKIGQLEQEKNGRNQTTTYQYDKAGRLTQFTDPVGTVTYTYDANNNVTAVTDGNGKTLTRTFDKLNRVEQYTDEYGNTIQYTYDAAGNLKTLTYPDGKTVTYTYDAAGRMKTVTDWKNRVLTYEYDQNGRLISTRRPNGTVETRTYDAKGQLLSLTDKRADGSVIHAYTYTYDAVGNVVTEKDGKPSVPAKMPNANAATFTTKDTLDITGPGLSPNPLPVTDSPTAEKDGKPSVPVKMLDANAAAFTTKDTLNINGPGLSLNPLSVTDSPVTEERGKSSAAAKIPNADEAAFSTKGTLDITGPGLSPNPLPVADGSGTKKGGKSSVANATMTYTADNRLATYNGHAVSYDADGNLISGPLNNTMQTYTYDARNRLIEAGDTRYGYNSEDIRTSVTTADSITIRYVVNPHTLFSQVLMETNDQNKPQAWYVYGLDLIGREDEVGQYRTYHYDRRGSTVALTDKNAQVTDTYTYGHYGEVLEHQGETEQPFRYNGRDGVITDANGLYYMRARYYNPEIKRFVNRDVVAGAIDYAQTLNRYAYVNGNPISYVDPFGLERIKSTYVAANPRYVAYNSVYKPQAPSLSVFRGLWNDLGEYGERKAREKDRGMSKDEALFILQLIGGPKGGGVKSVGGAKGAGKVITAGKNFKDHFIRHKGILEKALGTKYPKYKTHGDAFLKDIGKIINDGTVSFVGKGTLKKGGEVLNIYRGKGMTVATKPNGEFVTLLESGKGMDLSIRFVP